MVEISVFDGKTKRVLSVDSGVLLSQALQDNGIVIDMPCGGKGICGRCAVKASGGLSEISKEEHAFFSKVQIDSGMRLACRAHVHANAHVQIDLSQEISKILDGGKIISQTENRLYKKWGLAVDIGTTTICAQLVGANGETHLATRKNPQTAYGADVISRIEKALDGGGRELAASIRDGICEMALELAEAASIATSDIEAAVLTGNTAMLYLFAEHTPETLSHAPFNADRLFGEFVEASSLNLNISQNAKVYLPRCMSAFVGADITTAVLASEMCDANETALLVDIGTNGEIALWHDGKLSCCSTAAGPAFEGGGISKGVYGILGAIDSCRVENDKIICTTIGDKKAVGICGSGIVDAVAAMLRLEIIDETGAFVDDDELILAEDVSVTAQDVRKIQLAKGSVRAGIETLLQVSKVSNDDVKTMYIAGGFGNYVNLKNAAAIGLIPPELLAKSKCIGNAAHTGAAMLLQDGSLLEKSQKLASFSQSIPLDGNPIFTDHYMQCMMFE